MGQRIFVKVVGFTDVERHALNTVFRLSDSREVSYCLWMPDAPEAPRLALFDGLSYEAPVELESPHLAGMRIIWVGPSGPASAWRTFQRPIAWTEIVAAMDQLFAPDPLDFDLGFGEDTTLPPPADDAHPKRALIASPDRDERLYLRARLALANMTQADEAETGAQALELARQHEYDVALVDFHLPDVEGWAFLKELKQARPPIPHLIVTKSGTSLADSVRGWLSGAQAFLPKPPHPGKLQRLLRRV
ncbi:response regulator transcription factor [Caenimonas aquaedulcis]|uniref:Response regulator n=1 Tax=Caenimonas aquaedulcis TaxID=2793270 RepID=A0A931H237_9BURK|nr:response regulator [Caenimonas aquaedulcis]MBG9387113.1 response regulator [Caenimonas aquaedulcis]